MASKTNEICDRKLVREKKIFYELCADGVLKFGDGKTLKINKAQLATRSDVFLNIFCESKSKTVFDIPDYDLPTFKLFLDCLMGFQKCTVLDTLLVFPLALKYETEEFISQCIEILKPTTLNENVCLSLNIALVCDCKELTKKIEHFLVKNDLIETIFEEEKYYSLLQPESVVMLLKHVQMDSYLLQNIFKWGNNYLKKNNWRINLRSLFTEHKIINKLSLTCFETTQAILDFNESELGKNFFSIKDCWNHVIKTGFDPRKSEWVKVRKGEKINEKFIVSQVALLSGYKTNTEIIRNEIVLQNKEPNDGRFSSAEKLQRSGYEDSDEENDDDEDDSEDDSEDESEDESDSGSDGDITGKKVLHLNVTLKDSFRTLGSCTSTVTMKDNLYFKSSKVISIEGFPSKVSDIFVEIEFDFFHDCRILKTSPGPKPIQANDKDMYFTNLINISYVKI